MRTPLNFQPIAVLVGQYVSNCIVSFWQMAVITMVTDCVGLLLSIINPEDEPFKRHCKSVEFVDDGQIIAQTIHVPSSIPASLSVLMLFVAVAVPLYTNESLS